MDDRKILRYFAGSCSLIVGILLYCLIFSTSGRVAYKTGAVIDEYLPKVQLFVTNNQLILNDILLWWNSYTAQQEFVMDLSTNPLDYMVLSKSCSDSVNEKMSPNGIPSELVEKLLRIESDDTENVVISFISDGMLINYGRFPYTDVVIFSSEQWHDRYVPDGKAIFDLENEWIVAFIGVVRG